MYGTAVWTVKAGSEEDFRRAWQASADQASPDLPGVVFRLFRDVDDPSRFLSLSGPWRGREQLEQVRASEPFQRSLASLRALVEDARLSTLELVSEVS